MRVNVIEGKIYKDEMRGFRRRKRKKSHPRERKKLNKKKNIMWKRMKTRIEKENCGNVMKREKE